jgi:hypothetical protein
MRIDIEKDTTHALNEGFIKMLGKLMANWGYCYKDAIYEKAALRASELYNSSHTCFKKKYSRLLNSSLVILNLCLYVVPTILLMILYLLDSLSPPNWQLPKVDGYIWSCRLRPTAKRQNPPYLELIRPTKSSSQHPSLGFFISTYWASVLSSNPNSWWLEACLCQDS